jgi:DNA-binding winged helix-turn-helix (wHTH) protein
LRHLFGELVLDGSQRQLLRDNEIVHLSPKAFELLSLLVDRAPAAVSKEEIVQIVWPRVHVSDASLTNTVAEIRAATGDKARQPKFLRTVHGFGYAFCGELSHEAGPIAEPLWWLLVAGRRYALAPGENLVGREPTATVLIDHSSVSRRHARLSVKGTDVVVEDLGSRNGTFVNGQRVDAPLKLRDGDVIGLGPVTIVVEGFLAGGSTETQPRAEDTQRR